MLGALRRGTRGALGANLVGVYLRGSLATGDFTATSDLDVLTVTERPLDDVEFAALGALHAYLAALPNRYAGRFEVAYIDRVAIRRFVPGQRHPTLYWGEALTWCEHRANWILERWTVREHGVPLLGPDPKALLDPIRPDELRMAVRARLGDWADWADRPDNAHWPIVYTVETMCRALCTLARGEFPRKACAVAWAMATLPEPWRATIERSRGWRARPTVDRTSIELEVRRFVKWAAFAGEAEGGVHVRDPRGGRLSSDSRGPGSRDASVEAPASGH